MHTVCQNNLDPFYIVTGYIETGPRLLGHAVYQNKQYFVILLRF